MNHRMTQLLAAKAFTADATEPIDINVADPISALHINYRGLNTNGSAGTAHPAACITKIELVDGSDVLFSANGREAQAMDFYHRKVESQQWLQYLNDNYFDMIFNINFGRHLWDESLALDPKKFTNLQLKITIDLDAGGVAPDAGQLTVMASIFDEKPIAPIGFLMHKELYSYTVVASSHEYVDLPTDYPYRKAFIRAQRYGTEPNQQISNIKLSEDNDKRVILDDSEGNILRNWGNMTPPYKEYIAGQGNTSAQYFYCTPTQTVSGSVNSWVTASPTYHAFYDGDGGRFRTLGNAAKNWIATVMGFQPHGVLEIPFGKQDIIEDWYDVTKIGSLRFDITAASSVGSSQTAEVLVQQLRKYAA